jgi:hypothetical protein
MLKAARDDLEAAFKELDRRYVEIPEALQAARMALAWLANGVEMGGSIALAEQRRCEHCEDFPAMKNEYICSHCWDFKAPCDENGHGWLEWEPGEGWYCPECSPEVEERLYPTEP